MPDSANRALVIYPQITGREDAARDPDLRLEEARGLAEALDLDVVEARTETLRAIRPGLFFGEGKAQEIAAIVTGEDVGVVFVDTALSTLR